MSAVAQELLEIVDGLPEDKARAVMDFARFLQPQAGDGEWKRIIRDACPRPKLDAGVAAALHEGQAGLRNTNKL